MKELILKTILEGAGLSALLLLVCAVGIRKGTVGMGFLAAMLAGIMTLFIHSIL